ncbi:MAG: AAA family ATPase, partial [Chromatiales bacterium]|nr:AAA family ATPase [Chromatiales bacterium]
MSIIEKAFDKIDDKKSKGNRRRSKHRVDKNDEVVTDTTDTSERFVDGLEHVEGIGGLDWSLDPLSAPAERLDAPEESRAVELESAVLGAGEPSPPADEPQPEAAAGIDNLVAEPQAVPVTDKVASAERDQSEGELIPKTETGVSVKISDADASDCDTSDNSKAPTNAIDQANLAPPPASATETTDDQTLTTRQDSQRIEVSLERLGAAGMLTPTSDRTVLAEQFRAIKRPLLMQVASLGAERKTHANLILVASALPNEGKTSTAINLAMSIAQEQDQTVLLVDGDVAKADITRHLGIEAQLGLTDLLADSSLGVADVMLRTNIPKLTIIPAGHRHPNVTELFSGDYMRALMSEFAQRYTERIVIIDSPPLLATSGASVLASLAGQILMVVEAVRTPQQAVLEALRMLG